jgi:outer membrane protein assembly factor BamB
VLWAGLAVEAVLSVRAAAAIPAWTTYRHDAARSGIDPDSTGPTTPSPAWRTPALDGEVYAQPLVYGPYVYVATENDSVYKLSAATGAVVWSAHLATPQPSFGSHTHALCGNINPSIGITSTPVIDPGSGRIYAVGAVLVSGAVHHELFALGLGSGQLVPGFPVMVDPPFPKGGSAALELQRPGLALDQGRILIGYGAFSGCGPFWGFVVSAPTNGTSLLSSFQVDAGARWGGIWSGGNAPPINAAGEAFVATGDGTSTSPTDPQFGSSVVRLNAAASPLDWWAPPNWMSLDASDLDLSSGMPTLLPGGYLFQSGKDGNGYLLNGANLGHVSSPAAGVPSFCPRGSYGGSVFDPANSTIYAACQTGLKGLRLGSGSPPSLTVESGFSAPAGAMGPPMIAGGLVWVTNPYNGRLFGLDLTSGRTKSQFSIPENRATGGTFVNHFASPSAGGGRLFVASGDQVSAFTLAQAPRLTASISPRRFTAKQGAKLRATLSEAATLKVAITTRRHGHLRGRRCSLRAHRGKTCSVGVTVLRLRFRAHRGRNAFKLRLRHLHPGRYAALVFATDRGGHRSHTVHITFRIVRARH